MKKIFLLILLVTQLSSCTIAVTVSVFNNTENDVTVNFKDGNKIIESGKSEYIKSWTYYEISIQSGNQTATYDPPHIQDHNIVWKGWRPFLKRIVYVQLQPNGTIWFTGKKTATNKFLDQPSGFPIKPEN